MIGIVKVGEMVVAEPEINQRKNRDNISTLLFVFGILFVAFNLRPAITSVGPLIGTIRDDIGFSNWSVAFLTSLPLIAFAIMSPIAPKLANKLSNELALALGLFILIIGISLRSVSFELLLFLGTLCIGTGIAVCNVLLPGVIKDKFPHKVAIMTSLYTSSMAIFATTASGVSIPLADGLQLGWQLALFVWVIPALIGLIIWLYISIKGKQQRQDQMRYFETQKSSGIWKSALAWKIGLFMGLQSFVFYVMISWLPEIIIAYGFAKETGGLMLSYFQLIGIPISFTIPMLATRMTSQRPIVLTVNTLFIIGIIILLTNQSFIAVIVATTLLGIGTSSNFALSLTFFSIRANHAKDAAELSGMAQSIGYCVSATGPIIIGFVFDLTHNWSVPLFLLIGITIAVIYFGLHAGKNQYVLEDVDGGEHHATN